MAMSAFRSTTRRKCQIDGYSSSAEAGGAPSTPRSRRDPSPSGRGFHGRSASVTDFSARYLSDSSSNSEFRSSYKKGSRTGRRSVCPSDSEGDIDSFPVHHHRYHKRGADSDDEILANSSCTKTGFIKSEQKGLQRALSSQEFSQAIDKGQHVPVLSKNTQAGAIKALEEEKTVRAVYAQLKLMHTDPPVGDVGMMGFLDAMRTEVRRAVADIRTELEEEKQPRNSFYLQSMCKSNNPSVSSNAENRPEPHGTAVIKAVADIRKEYTTKLEESEKRVRELWSQIAVEERRCLELSKIVKELLPTQPPASEQASMVNGSSSRRKHQRRKNSAEGQLDSKCLDEEAQRYFEECVSISSYDCQGDSDDHMAEKEKSSDKRKHAQDFNPKLLPTGSNGKGEQHPKASSVGSDGVVLPWLQWEAEAGAACDRNLDQVETSGKVMNGKSNASHRPGGTFSQSSSSNASKNLSRSVPISSWSGSRDIEIKSDICDAEQEPRVSTSALFHSDDNITTRKGSSYIDVDSLLFETIKFRCRIERGELLLCRGLFLA